tara:strand:- start:164 stop:493 length:330 start_codon:yes stop_codon:yes gene_type:complete
MKTAYEQIGDPNRTRSKKGERSEAIKKALEKRGKPGTVNQIEALLPDSLRVYDYSLASTRATCNRLFKEKELKRWGGKRTKQYMYGLPDHNPPKAFFSPLEKAKKWVAK